MRIEDTIDMGNGALPLAVQIETYDTAGAHPFVPGHKFGVRLSVMEKRTVSKQVAVEMLEAEKLFFCDVRGPSETEVFDMAIAELEKWVGSFTSVHARAVRMRRMLARISDGEPTRRHCPTCYSVRRTFKILTVGCTDPWHGEKDGAK